MLRNLFSNKNLFLGSQTRRCLSMGKINHAEHSYPLDGIRILDLTRIIAGPYCTMVLGDLGAEVIKIERPHLGDESRKWGPPFIENSTDSVYFMAANRNKKSVCVDLKSGQKIILDLVKKCDVLVENFIPGKLNEFGLDYDTLKEITPSLIYCSISGYGPSGPYSRRPGYDVIAASMGGLLHITGAQDGPPSKAGVAITDIAAGLYAHGAILAALLQRTKTGRGQKIDVNLFSTQVACLINLGSNYLNAGIEAKRWGTAHASIVPYQAFKTKSGYLTVGAGSDAQFKELCNLLTITDTCNHKKFMTNKVRVENRQELLDILEPIFLKRTNEQWMKLFRNATFPVGPVNNMQEVFSDPHLRSIKLVKTLEHKEAGPIKVVGPPVVYSEAANIARSAPPKLGEHTDEVLSDLLNYDTRTLSKLKLSNIIQ